MLIPTVSESSFIPGVFRRFAFEVGARQIVEQYLELGVEQILPSLLKMHKNAPLMIDQVVVASIQLVNLGQCRIDAYKKDRPSHNFRTSGGADATGSINRQQTRI